MTTPATVSPQTSELFVYMPLLGKNLLQHIRAPVLKTWRPGRPRRPDGPDIVLFQASQTNDFVEEAVGLDDSVWAKVKRGGGNVVFDASLEGRPHVEARTDLLHRLLRQVGVPLEAAVYVTQDRQYAADYSRYCRRLGLARTMRVVCYDYWIRRFLAAYETGGEAVLAERLAAFRARPARRDRRFVSLNLTPRPVKVLLLLKLLREGLWEQGFVSFGGFERLQRVRNKSLPQFQKDLLGLPGFEDAAADLVQLLPTLDQMGCVLMGRPATSDLQDIAALQDDALPEYSRSWFSIVTETEMMGRGWRITEKALKPLFNLHPLVMFGNPGALRMIRDLGFQTFSDTIDESYDDEPDPRRRFDMAFAQVRRLCAMDETELAQQEARLAEVLAFNASWGLTRLPALYRDEIDAALMQQIMAPTPPAPCLASDGAARTNPSDQSPRRLLPKAALSLAWTRDLAACVEAPAGAEPKTLVAMLKSAWGRDDRLSFLAATRALAALGAARAPYAVKMARALLEVGEPGEALALLQADTSAEPSRDPGHALALVLALHGVGRDEDATAAAAGAEELGKDSSSPELARRLGRALDLGLRGEAAGGWSETAELICDHLQWGLVDSAARLLADAIAAGAIGDEAMGAVLDFALAAFRTASPPAAERLLQAMGPLFRQAGLEEDHREAGAVDVITRPRPKGPHVRKLLRCLAGVCAGEGRWRAAAGRLGELAGGRASADVWPELARCLGQDRLSEQPLAFAPPADRRRVFDLFPYNGEAMMLQLKLNEMAPWVDRFVIVEARSSFSGEAKPIHLETQRPLFEAFWDKIIHVVVDAFPERLDSAWSREFFQRDSAVRGLQGLAAPDDLVLLTDADEIIDRRALEGFDRDIAPVRLRFFQYFLNCEYVHERPAPQAVALRARFLHKNGASYLRLAARDREKGREIEDAGWHFSSVDAPEALALKMRSFSHQEHAARDGEHFERLLGALRAGEPADRHVRRELDESFPAYVRANREVLAPYLL